MVEDRRVQLYSELNLKETDDLLAIWQNKNLDEWEQDVFEIVRAILVERLGSVPAQSDQARVNELIDSYLSFRMRDSEEYIRNEDGYF